MDEHLGRSGVHFFRKWKNYSKPSFETWLKTTRPLALKDQDLIVEVPNDFTKSWIQNHYQNNISKIMEKIGNFQIYFVTPQKMNLKKKDLLNDDVFVKIIQQNNKK